MYRICLAIHRFRKDRKEAISKNFVNLAEQLSLDPDIDITTYSPVLFSSEANINQDQLNRETKYSSLFGALINLFLICRNIRKDYRRESASV